MVDYNDGKWHAWNGGECPVHPESLVETYRLDQSSDYLPECRGEYHEREDTDDGSAMAGGIPWHNPPYNKKIIAFRVVKEYKEPREVFLAQKPHGGVWLEVLPEHEYAVKFREVIE